jgi:hypothetical protein
MLEGMERVDYHRALDNLRLLVKVQMLDTFRHEVRVTAMKRIATVSGSSLAWLDRELEAVAAGRAGLPTAVEEEGVGT